MRTELVIAQGTTWAITWPITDTAGNPLNIDGWTVRSQVRPDAASPTVLHQWSTTLGNAEAANSTVTLSVRPVDSTPWTWRRGVYDVELVDLTGRVARITEGSVTVSPEVTR
jgi:hypothetical protein